MTSSLRLRFIPDREMMQPAGKMCNCREGVEGACELISVANLDAVYFTEAKMMMMMKMIIGRRPLGVSGCDNQVGRFGCGTLGLLKEPCELGGRSFQSPSSAPPPSARPQHLVVPKALKMLWDNENLLEVTFLPYCFVNSNFRLQVE